MPKQLIPDQLTPKQLSAELRILQDKMPKRYLVKAVVEHLASQYVLGTLTDKTRQRVTSIARYNALLAERIDYWQNRFVSLDQQTPALAPSEMTWQNIADKLDINKENNTEKSKQITPDNAQPLNSDAGKFTTKLFEKLSKHFILWLTPNFRFASGFAVLIFAVFSLFFNPLANKADPLSYVAVLTQQGGEAHLVASTYGDSKKLVVNVINSPKISAQESLELWVVSKTDAQARSLGVISLDKTLVEQQLTTAQWRLIKDSASLIVTIEEVGGSAIGEPSETIVSSGLCIRLQEWQKNA
jgi:anti-sigma-K factor RskA